MVTRISLDADAVRRLANDRNGPVIRYTASVAQQVKTEARRRVGVSREPQSFSGRGQPQHLRDAIVTRIVERGGTTVVRVIAARPYAVFHHEGTRPHVIRPVRAKALRFTVGRVVVFAKKVNHPGTRPNRFLADAARVVGLRVRRMR